MDVLGVWEDGAQAVEDRLADYPEGARFAEQPSAPHRTEAS
jgi:hypothetical protein